MSYFGQISPEAALEIDRLMKENDSILDKKTLTRSDKTRVDANLAKISAIKKAGITTDEYRRAKADQLGGVIVAEERRAVEAHEKIFRGFLNGKSDDALAYEARDVNALLAGGATVAFTAGPRGGVLVPMKFSQSVAFGLAAVDPLLDPNVCTVIQEKNFSLPPLQLPGWNLSSITAQKIDESTKQDPDVVPTVEQKLLNKYAYRVTLAASLEFEEDQRAFERLMDGMGKAFGIAFARGIGADLVNGDGTAGPSGILNGLTPVMTTAGSGVIVLADINDVFYSVNPIYRASEKCGWLMNDIAHKALSNATDPNGRPLIKVVDGVEFLKGKPIHITPSLSATAGDAGSFCVFGDLSYFNVHVSTMWMRRSLQAPGYVENGQALFTGLMLCDAVLHDPTEGDMPPVVVATMKA